MSVIRSIAIVLCAASALPAAATAAPQSHQFLTDAMKGDNSEIMLGKVAEADGGSAGVRSFGQTLVTDHTKAKSEVAALARREGVPVTDQPMAEAQQEKTKLAGLHGSAFDHEFARYMVNDHQKDIAKFEAEAKQGKGAVADLARKQLPTLRKHLAIAQRLAR